MNGLMDALVMSDVSFFYEHAQPTLDALSLTLASEERIAIVGKSGVGKSSLLRAIAGLEKISGGRILIQGECVSDEFNCLHPSRRGVGMVFQDWAVFPHLSVFGNIAFGLNDSGKSALGCARVFQLLEEFELQGMEERMPSTLSGGQLQRVACARALAPRPKVLLLDEAFSSLDELSRDRIRQQVVCALMMEKAAAILVTHDIDEAFSFAHRVFELRAGKLLQMYSPSNRDKRN